MTTLFSRKRFLPPSIAEDSISVFSGFSASAPSPTHQSSFFYPHLSLPSSPTLSAKPNLPITSPPSSTNMLSPPDASSSSSISSPFSDFIKSVFSYNGNVMLAALVSLLLVILFVLVLHIYAKWFLAHARHRRSSSVSVSHVLRPTRFHHVRTFTFETTLSASPTKGLDSSAISSIPVFVYKAGEHKHGLECVICLSIFEDDDIGRSLPKCGHAFHIECIDMWLHSHSNCPLCRAPLEGEKKAAAILNEGNLELSEALSGELGLIDGGSLAELLVEIPDSESGNAVTDADDSLSASSSQSSQSSSIGSSLRRMLSRNRSEHKVHPSSISNESEA